MGDCLSAPFAVNERNTYNEKEEGVHPLAFIPANVRLSMSLDRGSEAGM
jgi:hypothetical protein